MRRATSARLTVSPMQRLQRAGAGAAPVGASELKTPKFRAGPSYLPGLWNPRWLMEQALTAIIQEAWISSVPRRWVEELAQAIHSDRVSCNTRSRCDAGSNIVEKHWGAATPLSAYGQ